MFLVVVRSGHDDVPVRLFKTLKAAKGYASSNWNTEDGEASEELYKEVADACNTLRFPQVTDIAGIDIVGFRNGFVSANRWSAGIQVRMRSDKRA